LEEALGKAIKEIIDREPGGVTIFDVTDLNSLQEPFPHHFFVRNSLKEWDFSAIKNLLQKIYPSQYPVMVFVSNKDIITQINDNSGESWTSLSKLPQLSSNKDFLFLYLPPFKEHSVGELMGVMEKLRGENGCPWDQQQDHQSLRPYVIEEAYEVVEAIEQGNMELLQEELGDLLLQVIFHAQLGRESGLFKLPDVVQKVITKLIRRHPHVFSSTEASTAGEVLVNWEEIKKQEKSPNAQKQGVLQVDPSLPALMKAEKVQSKASRVGFDWDSLKGPLQKLKEEINELEDAYHGGHGEKIEEIEGELGDLLFSIVNVSRFLGINPETALNATVNKFKNRFAYIEAKVAEEGNDMKTYHIDQLENWWQEAKKKQSDDKNNGNGAN